jgi:hypothetical protein
MEEAAASFRVAIRYFDGCSHWRTMYQRLNAALGRVGHVANRVELERVETPEDAERLRFVGSPTLLLDGEDPFAPGRCGQLRPVLSNLCNARGTGWITDPGADARSDRQTRPSGDQLSPLLAATLSESDHVKGLATGLLRLREPITQVFGRAEEQALGQNSAMTFEHASLGTHPTTWLASGWPARMLTSIRAPHPPHLVRPEASVANAAAIPTMSYAHHVHRVILSNAIECSVGFVVSPSIPTIVPSPISAMPTEATSRAARCARFRETPAIAATSSMDGVSPEHNARNAARRTGSAARSIASRSLSRQPGACFTTGRVPAEEAGDRRANLLRMT